MSGWETLLAQLSGQASIFSPVIKLQSPMFCGGIEWIPKVQEKSVYSSLALAE